MTEFTDLSVPNVDEEYYCFEGITSTGFTHLMKLVLMVKEYPDALPVIEKLIVNKSMLDAQNNAGHTALMFACRYSRTHDDNVIVKMLINAGANLDLQDNRGNTALMHSSISSNALKSDFETMKILIDSGANVNITDFRGYTMLMMECAHYGKKYNIDRIRMLINAGSDVNICDSTGCDVLMLICNNRTNDVEIVQLLIDAGSNVNHQCKTGHTSAMFSLREPDVTKLLISKNYNVNLKNCYGDTILSHLVSLPSDDYNDTIIDLIHRSVETLYDADKIGKTAYDYYVRSGKTFLDVQQLKLLKGDIRFNNTKSARC